MDEAVATLANGCSHMPPYDWARLHADASSQVTPFTLLARDDGTIALGGEIDIFNCAAFEQVLAGVPASPTGRVVIDMAALKFFDHRALLALERFAEQRDATLTLRAAPHVARRLMELLDCKHLRLDDAS